MVYQPVKRHIGIPKVVAKKHLMLNAFAEANICRYRLGDRFKYVLHILMAFVFEFSFANNTHHIHCSNHCCNMLQDLQWCSVLALLQGFKLGSFCVVFASSRSAKFTLQVDVLLISVFPAHETIQFYIKGFIS